MRITPKGGWRGSCRCSKALLFSLSSSARRFLPSPAAHGAHAETLPASRRALVCASVHCMDIGKGLGDDAFVQLSLIIRRNSARNHDLCGAHLGICFSLR